MEQAEIDRDCRQKVCLPSHQVSSVSQLPLSCYIDLKEDIHQNREFLCMPSSVFICYEHT